MPISLHLLVAQFPFFSMAIILSATCRATASHYMDGLKALQGRGDQPEIMAHKVFVQIGV